MVGAKARNGNLLGSRGPVPSARKMLVRPPGGWHQSDGWLARALRFLARLGREHRLISVAVGLSFLPRLLAALAFRPALLTPDSFGYLHQGVHFQLAETRPSGYPVLLQILEPFHSLLLVTTVQHLMGVAVAVMVYGALRHWGLPAWGSVLAACPTLFDPREVALESYVWPDPLYLLLITAGVVLLVIRQQPRWTRFAPAGLLLGLAAVVRGNGIAEVVGVLAVLLLIRPGWRVFAAASLAAAIPILGYMTLFDYSHGQFAITNSDGMFIWSRTITFANCAVIKPPADLRPLCPDRQPYHPPSRVPAWSASSTLHSPIAGDYLWAPGVWWRRDAHPGINPYNNALAKRFALAAIRAQPGDYVRTVAEGVFLIFADTDRAESVHSLAFTAKPDVGTLYPAQRRFLRAYDHTTAPTRAVQPYAYLLLLYQQPVYFPGLIFLLAVLAGLAGIVRNWRRRGGPALLPWVAAVIGIVAPVAVHESLYRYAITVVPLTCLAAGLAFAPGRQAPPGADRPRSSGA